MSLHREEISLDHRQVWLFVCDVVSNVRHEFAEDLYCLLGVGPSMRSLACTRQQ